MIIRRWLFDRASFTFCLALLTVTSATMACSSPTAESANILYLSWDEAGEVQLFSQQALTGARQQLTGNDPALHGSVTTFSPAPNGESIAYSMTTADGASEIRLIRPGSSEDDLLLACPAAECTEISWAPDNRRLTYERRELGTGTSRTPHLWWLDATTSETLPLIEDAGGPAYGATFSPDGQQLAYVSPKEEGLVVVNLLDDTQTLVSSDTGMRPLWLNDSHSLVFSRGELTSLAAHDADDQDDHSHALGTAVHLFRQEMADSTLPLRLSPDAMVDDGTPTISPDGEWLAFGRRLPQTTSGRQIWIMRTDGSEAKALTHDAAVNHGPAEWSPDGRQLLYQQFNITESDARPSIWLMDLETGQQRKVADVGFLPQWQYNSD